MTATKMVLLSLLTLATPSAFSQGETQRYSRSEAQTIVFALVKHNNPKYSETQIIASACPMAMMVGAHYDFRRQERLPQSEIVEVIRRTSLESREFDKATFHCAKGTNKRLLLADLKANAAQHEGSEIVVEGYGMFVAGSFFIKSSLGDTSPTPIDATHVSPRLRTEFVKNCGDVGSRCAVAVIGVARRKLGGAGVNASHVFVME